MNWKMQQRRAERNLRDLGTLGAAGVVMVVAAVFYAIFVVRPMLDERSAWEEKVADAEHRLQTVPAGTPALAAAGATGRAERLLAFYAGLPQEGRVPAQLDRLYRAAEKKGLVLDVGEYVWKSGPQDRLGVYRATFPVQGTFDQIVAFVQVVLENEANVALESVSFKRERIDSTRVEARIVFAVFTQRSP